MKIEKKYNIVYKTVNLINSKCYIGVHSTNKIDDNYLGCGFKSTWDLNKIKHSRGIIGAFKKYGVHNFKREVLFYCNSREEAFKKEAEIVDIDWVKSEHNYNLCLGGVNPVGYEITTDIAKKLSENCAKNFVVVNTKTSEVHHVRNLGRWSKDNHLTDKSGVSRLHNVVRGHSTLIDGTWWACREENWTGKVVLKEDKNNIPRVHKGVTLISPEGSPVFIEDLKLFCKINNYSYSSFLRIINKENLKAKYWTTSFENHFKVVSYFKLDGKVVRIENIKKYCKENNLQDKYLSKVKNKKIKNYKGYTLYEK